MITKAGRAADDVGVRPGQRHRCRSCRRGQRTSAALPAASTAGSRPASRQAFSVTASRTASRASAGLEDDHSPGALQHLADRATTAPRTASRSSARRRRAPRPPCRCSRTHGRAARARPRRQRCRAVGDLAAGAAIPARRAGRSRPGGLRSSRRSPPPPWSGRAGSGGPRRACGRRQPTYQPSGPRASR